MYGGVHDAVRTLRAGFCLTAWFLFVWRGIDYSRIVLIIAIWPGDRIR